MLTTSLDILEKSQLPSPQAKAILQVMELEFSAQHDVVATKTDLSAVKTDLLAMKADMKADISRLELKLEAGRVETVRWIMASTGIMLGAFYFFLNYARR